MTNVESLRKGKLHFLPVKPQLIQSTQHFRLVYYYKLLQQLPESRLCAKFQRSLVNLPPNLFVVQERRERRESSLLVSGSELCIFTNTKQSKLILIV